jgi:hypothetical protein
MTDGLNLPFKKETACSRGGAETAKNGTQEGSAATSPGLGEPPLGMLTRGSPSGVPTPGRPCTGGRGALADHGAILLVSPQIGVIRSLFGTVRTLELSKVRLPNRATRKWQGSARGILSGCSRRNPARCDSTSVSMLFSAFSAPPREMCRSPRLRVTADSD